jgi:hypothetical protein
VDAVGYRVRSEGCDKGVVEGRQAGPLYTSEPITPLSRVQRTGRK